MKLRSNHVNTGSELYPYMIEAGHREAIDELVSHLDSLNGPVRRVLSYFGIDSQFHVSSGHVDQFDLNHVLARLAGSPSMETGVGTSVQGGGKGYSLSDMFLSSLGEAVERLVASVRYFANFEKI